MKMEKNNAALHTTPHQRLKAAAPKSGTREYVTFTEFWGKSQQLLTKTRSSIELAPRRIGPQFPCTLYGAAPPRHLVLELERRLRESGEAPAIPTTPLPILCMPVRLFAPMDNPKATGGGRRAADGGAAVVRATWLPTHLSLAVPAGKLDERIEKMN